MSDYNIRQMPMEADYNRALPPSVILRQSLDCILEDIELQGCDRTVIEREVGAVWMISRMRFYQFSQVHPWDVLRYHTFPRVIENGRYIFYIEIFRGDEMVIQFDTVFIPVDEKRRKIVEVDVIEPFWKDPPRTAESKFLVRLDMDCEFTPGGKQTVRMSDCDTNHHLTSPGYLSLVCDELGFWGGEERMMKFMQVDYVSEVLPGMEISFETGRRGEMRLLRGHKPDGKLAFSAGCIF